MCEMLENLSISECLSGAFFPLSSPSTSFLIFFLSLAISLLPWSCPSLLGGGIMWSSGELNTGAEAAAAWWIIDGNLGVTRLGLLTSLLLHLAARLTRQNGGSERAREREREREKGGGGGGVHCSVRGCCLLLTPSELWMKRQRC